MEVRSDRPGGRDPLRLWPMGLQTPLSDTELDHANGVREEEAEGESP